MSAPPAPRLLMTTDAVGGVWTYALDLANVLAQAGVRTTLVTLGPSPRAHQAQAALSIPGLALIDTNLPLDWMAREPAEILETAAALRGLARGNHADLIHLNSPALAALGGFPAPVVGACHSCLATWWSAVKEGPMPSDFSWRTQALRQGLLACDALAAPSLAFAEATARTYELPRPHVVRNGRRPVAPLHSLRRERLVFASGRLWDEGKDVETFDQAAALVEGPACAAGSLEGPNGERRTLQNACALGQLTGEEVAEWLCRAPVFVSTALYEPFGLGVLEAAQAGCALVLSDIESFRELWDGAAIFVEPRDAAGFAAACNRLLGEPGLAARLGRTARAHAARYGVEAMCAGMLDLYRRLAPRFAAVEAEAAA